MSLALRILALILLALAFSPEVGRYKAERALYRASSALRIAISSPEQVGDVTAATSWIEREGVRVAGALPHDPRPRMVAGAACLVGRRPEAALEHYRAALLAGERAEIDLNIGRAHMMQRDLGRAQVAFLRAGWLSPPILDSLPPVARDPLLAELTRLLVPPPPP